jgi:cell division protein FtsQ
MNEMKHKVFGVSAIIGIVVILVFCANGWKSSLKVKEIRIEGNRLVGTNEVSQLTQVQLGSLLYEADLTAIQRNVMSHYYIKDVVVERNLPSAIRIVVTERIPVAMVNSSQPFYFDQDGMVLPKSNARKIFDLPMISGVMNNGQLVLGSIVIQSDVQEAVRLLSALKAVNRPMYHNISEVQVRNGGDIVLFAAEGGVPIIFGRGEIASKLVRLESFWNDIVKTRGPQTLQYVDLRYQDQIVARWNSEPAKAKQL